MIHHRPLRSPRGARKRRDRVEEAVNVFPFGCTEATSNGRNNGWRPGQVPGTEAMGGAPRFED